MNSKREPLVLNFHNHGIWAQDMETLLKGKALWKFTKIVVPNPKDEQQKFVIDEKKSEAI
jgi:hypothetical protein